MITKGLWLQFRRSDHGDLDQEKSTKKSESGVMARLTPESILRKIWYASREATLNRCTYPRINLLGGTRPEMFSTQPEPSNPRQIILDKTEHSAISLKEGRFEFSRPELTCQALKGC
jgi:hypothetical protein